MSNIKDKYNGFKVWLFEESEFNNLGFIVFILIAIVINDDTNERKFKNQSAVLREQIEQEVHEEYIKRIGEVCPKL